MHATSSTPCQRDITWHLTCLALPARHISLARVAPMQGLHCGLMNRLTHIQLLGSPHPRLALDAARLVNSLRVRHCPHTESLALVAHRRRLPRTAAVTHELCSSCSAAEQKVGAQISAEFSRGLLCPRRHQCEMRRANSSFPFQKLTP